MKEIKNKINVADVQTGSKFQIEGGTIFIIDSVSTDEQTYTWVKSHREGDSVKLSSL